MRQTRSDTEREREQSDWCYCTQLHHDLSQQMWIYLLVVLPASCCFLFIVRFCTCCLHWKSMRSGHFARGHLNLTNCMTKLLFYHFQLSAIQFCVISNDLFTLLCKQFKRKPPKQFRTILAQFLCQTHTTLSIIQH